MGPVIADGCEHHRGLIAMDVVGRLSVDERLALSAHTDGCPACRDERRDLTMLSLVLPTADPDHFDEQELPFGLRTAVLDRLRDDSRSDRHRRRSRIVLGSAAAALVAVVAVVAAVAWPSGSVTRTVALQGRPRVHAVVRLTAEPWGTAMELWESGQPQGEVLSVAMQTVSGSWWQTGTYRTAGASVRVTMACALQLSEIKSVWIRDHAGNVVMHGYLDPHTDGDLSQATGAPGATAATAPSGARVS